jgi:hypothetical protein
MNSKLKKMKQEKENETKAKSQNRCSIKDAFFGQFKLSKRIHTDYESTQSPLLWRGRWEAFRVYGIGLIVGKGPPGHSRSPDLVDDHPPENKAGPPVGKINYNNEYQLVNKNQNSILFNF